MTALELFSQYLQAIERRLRWKAIAGGAALTALLLLAATLALSVLANRAAFSDAVLFRARCVLFVTAGVCVALGFAVPLLRVNRRRAARLAEQAAPEFAQRAITLSGGGNESPLAELVAREALECAQAVPPQSVIRPLLLNVLAGAAAAGVFALLWLTLAAPGTVGYGARLLWAGAPPSGQGPLYQIQVRPGDARVRRGGDQVVEALIFGYSPAEVTLRARKAGEVRWQALRMEPRPGGGGYAFLFAGLMDDVEYQVEAGRLASAVHRLTLVDMPAVKKIRVVYHYPAYLGLAQLTEDPGGDIRAVEGTEAEVFVQTGGPLQNGALVLDDGSQVKLEAQDGLWLKARLPVRKDGSYYVAGFDGGSAVRLSEDYFIEAKPETPPTIRIARPGRDARVSPIEEVTVEVEAADDFGLQQVELNYSVNGGAEKTVALLEKKGVKQSSRAATIALEDFKLAPGDIVAISAAARDARAATQTDIYFLEAQPFEKEYQQSQISGGGGGGGEGEQQAEIAQRQKEIIAATWNQLKAPKPKGQPEEDAALLHGLQQKLAEQAKSLSQRMRSRQLAATNEEFQKFSKEMDQAAQDMTAAAGKLKGRQWRDALSPEQQALQHLLRAESLFRQIQVAFGQRGGGGGAGGQMRDLESLFDLELDPEKNQYETAQSGGGSTEERERQLDEALKKLEDLARRQQQQAQQRQERQQSFQQRWAQEMLRREAEELRRRMESLQNGQLAGRQQSGQAGAGQRQAAPGQPEDARLSRARQQLERAIDDMRGAQSQPGQQSVESARRAAERMAEARDAMSGMRRQQAGDRMGELARRASDLAARQRQYEAEVRKRFPAEQQQARPQPGQPAPSQAVAEQMAREKEAMERDYRSLEQGMKDTVRALSGSQQDAASRLREALGEAQQNELGLRLKFGSEWMRRGLGSYLAPRERVVTEMLDRLNQQVEQVRQMAGREGSSGERESTERALNQVERLRARVAAQLRARQGQPGQAGQQGQQQDQPGRQMGQQAGGAQRGERGGRGSYWRGEYGAMNDGARRDFDGRAGDGVQRELENAYDDAFRQLRQLRGGEAAADETQAELERVLQEMQRLNPRQFPGNPALLGRIESEILPQLEQLELRLRRQLDPARGGQARSGPAAKAPPGYGEAVAEYYRRLSRGK
jgi:hypothetical protein